MFMVSIVTSARYFFLFFLLLLAFPFNNFTNHKRNIDQTCVLRNKHKCHSQTNKKAFTCTVLCIHFSRLFQHILNSLVFTTHLCRNIYGVNEALDIYCYIETVLRLTIITFATL